MKPAQLDVFRNALVRELAATVGSPVPTEARLQRLRCIKQAILRIDHGEYGSCRRCAEDIPIKRLAAMPWATHCLQCQSELEHARADQHHPGRPDPQDDSDDPLCA